MKRKTATLLLGTAVIAGLAAAYSQLLSYNEKTEEAALEDAMGEEILYVDTASLVKVSFLINGQKETFEKTDETWKLERDNTFPVDEAQLLSPFIKLAPLQAVRILEDPEDPSEYGLTEPQNELTLTEEDGTVTTVTIGDTNSSIENAYVMLDQDPSVIYTVETTILSYLSDDLYDYAYSDEMPTLQVSDIVGASVDAEAGSYELYLEDAKWMVSDGEQSPVDQDAVNDAMSGLGSLSYEDYIEHNCTDDTLYGFDEKNTVLTIHYQAEVEGEKIGETEAASEFETIEETDETEQNVSEEYQTETEALMEERTVSFKIGTTDSLGNYYVQMIGSTEVHTLSSAVLEKFLEKTAEDWQPSVNVIF